MKPAKGIRARRDYVPKDVVRVEIPSIGEACSARPLASARSHAQAPTSVVMQFSSKVVAITHHLPSQLHSLAGSPTFASPLPVCQPLLDLIIAEFVQETAGGPFGLHAWDTKFNDYTKKRLVLSVLILYLNLFGLIKWLRYNAYVFISITGIVYCITAVLFVVFCGPEDGYSRLSYLKGATSPKCNQAHGLVYAQAIVNILSDLYLFILPLPVVCSLQMPCKKKLEVAAMFSTGLSACIASVLGLAYRILAFQSADTEWTTVPVQITAKKIQSTPHLEPVQPPKEHVDIEHGVNSNVAKARSVPRLDSG
ncbi:uncharacterized protein KY384_001140 [Bacidia gigantensis]|uniref:uncharacterized protein n=1 Tax=Bacidia gigantensis TaxID=2732470 RepID=UPI001D04A015|nr:uncharacterized protein KY384_001140 [Bacidia gigantensis]KAG8534296.1 hypothetical protein KY384_001140 [Bacidia gigantensis]